MRFAELDAVTVDGFGTLLELVDPVPALGRALERHGMSTAPRRVELAFATEAGYYRGRSHLGHDVASLRSLRQDCTRVFLASLGVELDPIAFADDFVAALEFAVVPGAAKALELLRSRGLLLAVVANWDYVLPDHLARLGLAQLFDTVVTSAAAGAPKPDPEPFRLALARLGVAPSRALHVGDEPADEIGARAAGMRFAPAPLADAVAEWDP